MESTTTKNGLKPSIGFLGLLAMCVGLNIGGALFALTSLAAGLTGPSLPLAMLVSAVPALLAVLPYGVLTSALPATSATYRYTQLVHPGLALVVMLTLAVCIMVGAQPLFALAFGKYLQRLVPLNPIMVGVAILTIFFLINLMGISLAACVQTIMFFVLMSALIMYVVLGLPHVSSGNFSVLFPKGIGGVFAAAGLLFTYCAGGFFVVDLGGEVIMARRIFPRVLFLGMLLVLALYLGILTVTVGVAQWDWLADKSLLNVADKFMSQPALMYFVVGGALAACATTINVIFSVVSRGLMVISREGLLPEMLGRVHPRFGTPYWGLTTAWVICVVSLVSIPSLMFFGSMLNLGLVLAITSVALAGMVTPKRYPALLAGSSVKVSGTVLKVVSVTVIAVNALIFVFFSVAIGKATFVFLGIVFLTLLYMLSRRRIVGSIRQEIKASPTDWCDKIRGS